MTETLAKKIVVACDSFKGSMTSAQANSAVEAGLRIALPGYEIEKIAVADGGEGTGEALAGAFRAKRVHMKTLDPLGRPVDAIFYVNPRTHVAVIDTAAASGLPLLRPDERDLMKASTYGTGLLAAAAIDMGCREIYIGLGGSATNDCGTGFMQALGYRFLDGHGSPLGQGGEILAQTAGIDSTRRHNGIDRVRFVLFTDVDNELCGPSGAAYTFGPQKGADPALCQALDEGARNFASVLALNGYDDTSHEAGAGAAGGMGAGLTAILRAEIRQGAPAILDAIQFDEHIFEAEFVITGEGRIDATTLRGKTPFAILQAARRQNIPVYAFAGSVSDEEALFSSGFGAVIPIRPPEIPLAEAMKASRARELLQKAVEKNFDINNE